MAIALRRAKNALATDPDALTTERFRLRPSTCVCCDPATDQLLGLTAGGIQDEPPRVGVSMREVQTIGQSTGNHVERFVSDSTQIPIVLNEPNSDNGSAR